MVATDAFMHFPEYVISGFLPYTLKNGCGEASFIKGPSMDGESCRLALSLDASFGSLGNVPSTK